MTAFFYLYMESYGLPKKLSTINSQPSTIKPSTIKQKLQRLKKKIQKKKKRHPISIK